MIIVPRSNGRRNDKGTLMGFRRLAEAIILQSIEDLWMPTHRQESLAFFKGEAFNICAEIAGMSVLKKGKLLRLLADSCGKIHGNSAHHFKGLCR